ncbi:MAG: beta strand repeat-containing protein, partial [Bacteroidota bacterium]
NIGGTSGITTLTATASGNTVNYTGTTQTVKVTGYSNLILSGSGTKTLGATTISSNLSISGTAIASLTGNSTAATLTLGGYGKNNGTWGSTSSSATNKTNTYFSSTAIVTVSTDTRPALTITANSGNKTYGQTFTTGAGSTNFISSGLLNGETIGSITIASTGAANTAAVGSYTIVPSEATGGTFTASNYNITYINGTLTVSEAPLTVTASAQSKNYGSTAPTTGTLNTDFTVTGLQNSDAASGATLTYSGSPAGNLATAALGSYTITPSALTLSSGSASNYSITYNTGTLTVNAAPLTVTASAQSKNYGTTAPTTGTLNTDFTVTGLQNSDAASGATLTYSGSPAGNLATAAVGSYTITPSALTLSSVSASNYSITYNTGTLTVNAAPLTVTASAQSKNYGSTAPTTGTLNTDFTVTGLQNSDAASGATLTYSGSPAGNLSTAAVGSYTITPSALTLSSGSTSNYSITYGTGTLTVNAVTNDWTGGTGNWNTAGNWSLSRVPSSFNDNITVSSGSPTLDVNYTLGTGRTFTISGSGGLIINPTSSLTIAGTANFGGKPVTLKSDSTGTASIGQITGTLSDATNVTVERYIPGITSPAT